MNDVETYKQHNFIDRRRRLILLATAYENGGKQTTKAVN